jgi:three-Cys-motif partner protein
MLEFHEDAIVLSGETGTKLKSEIIGEYYPTWWSITSGGEERGFPYQTAIVELNAGTGLNYIKDIKKIVLGSAGHALELKATNSNAVMLKLVLVESHPECFMRLKKVIGKKWPTTKWSETRLSEPDKDVYLVNEELTAAIDIIENLDLGNSLFFFDPLLYTPWSEIDKVARRRIKSYYKTGTEFIVFLFTSDWFLGRQSLELVPLPEQNDGRWTSAQQKAVSDCDDLFGDSDWRPALLTSNPVEEKMQKMIELYKNRLHTWFRYVVPLPFEPKQKQLYHLFMCSNYEVGISITKRFYAEYTKNQKYLPNNSDAYKKFLLAHPSKRLPRNARCSEWKILWAVIKDHEDGICDLKCSDLTERAPYYQQRHQSLEWLKSQGYLKKIDFLTNEWSDELPPSSYKLDWDFVKSRLGIDPPAKFTPLSSKNST